MVFDKQMGVVIFVSANKSLSTSRRSALICPRLALRQLLNGTGVHRLDKLEPLSENSFASGRVRKATRSIRSFIADGDNTCECTGSHFDDKSVALRKHPRETGARV